MISYYRKMSLGAVKGVEARGQAPPFVTGQTGDARVGGRLRIRLPFFCDRLIRSVGERGEYLVEMPHRLFGAARMHGRRGQPAEKLAAQMQGKRVNGRTLSFPQRLVC